MTTGGSPSCGGTQVICGGGVLRTEGKTDGIPKWEGPRPELGKQKALAVVWLNIRIQKKQGMLRNIYRKIDLRPCFGMKTAKSRKKSPFVAITATEDEHVIVDLGRTFIWGHGFLFLREFPWQKERFL